MTAVPGLTFGAAPCFCFGRSAGQVRSLNAHCFALFPISGDSRGEGFGGRPHASHNSISHSHSTNHSHIPYTECHDAGAHFPIYNCRSHQGLLERYDGTEKDQEDHRQHQLAPSAGDEIWQRYGMAQCPSNFGSSCISSESVADVPLSI